MARNTTGNGTPKPNRDTAEVTKFGPMAVSTTDTGRMARRTEGEDSSTLTATFTMVIGKTIRPMDSASTPIPTVHSMMDTGSMKSNMVREKSNGPMVLNMKVNIKMVKRMVLGNLVGLISQAIAAISLITTSTAKAHIHGPMAECLPVSGRIIRCTVRVCSPGQTVASTKAITTMTRKRDMVCFIGLMDASTMATGKEESKKEGTDGRTARQTDRQTTAR